MLMVVLKTKTIASVSGVGSRQNKMSDRNQPKVVIGEWSRQLFRKRDRELQPFADGAGPVKLAAGTECRQDVIFWRIPWDNLLVTT